MKYQYTLDQVASMTYQEQLDGDINRLFPPRYIVGSGYKSTRQVATEYLEGLIAGGDL